MDSARGFVAKTKGILGACLRRVETLIDLVIWDHRCRICGNWLVLSDEVYGICKSCREATKGIRPGALCLYCSARSPRENGLCPRCPRKGLPWERMGVGGIYQEPLDQWILQGKYQGQIRLAHPLAEWLVEVLALQGFWPRSLWLLPMPSHRGGIHPFLGALARHLASLWEVKVRTGWLRRRRKGTPQARLTGARRRRNVRMRDFVARSAPSQGLRVLLLDDVATTRTTLRMASRCLQKAGYRVEVVAVALSPRSPDDPPG